MQSGNCLPDVRKLLNLFYFEGKSQKDIANQMHVSLRTVRTHTPYPSHRGIAQVLGHDGIWIALMLNYILLQYGFKCIKAFFKSFRFGGGLQKDQQMEKGRTC